MTDNVFTDAEQVIINTIKAQLLSMIHTKQIFWNGVENDCVVAGGVFASLINDDTIKDIDVFVLNKNTLVYKHLIGNSAINNKWVIRDVDAGEYLDNPHIHGTVLNLNTKAQYILTDYTSREELLKSFDFKHTTVSYVPKEMKLYITRSAFDAIREKKLFVNGDNNPKHWREKKFKNRGWKFPVENKAGGFNLNQFGQVLGQSMAAAQPVDEVANEGPFFDSYQKTAQKVVGDWLDDIMKDVDPYLQTK